MHWDKVKRFLKKHRWKVIATAVTFVFILGCYVEYVDEENVPELVSYTEFVKDLDSGKIDTVYYSVSEEYMRYTLLNKETKKMTLEERLKYKDYELDSWKCTTFPAYEDFRKDLAEKGVNVVVRSFERNIVGSIIGLVPIVFFIYLLVGVAVMIKRQNGSSVSEGELIQTSSVKFEDVIGHDEVIDDVKFIVNLMKNPKLGESTGARIPRGVLFTGSAGTGKTLLAKAIAGEAGVPFIYMNASGFIEMYVGLGAKRVRDLFKVAKKHKPCIIFIDEIDAVGSKRGKNSHSEDRQTLNALLQEMDGFSTEKSIIVIGATNTPESLDKALLRAGRFDRKIEINPPKDWKVRKQIFEHYLKDKPVGGIDIDSVSRQLSGFTGADIESIVNEASLITAMNERKAITTAEIEEAIDKVVFQGNRRKENSENTDKRIVAYHEAGHAVLSYLLGIDIARASIIASTSGVGGAVFEQESDSCFMTDEDFRNRIMILYGGRASEKIKFNVVTTGASNDITKATNMMYRYIQRYGFDSDFGLLDIDVLEKYVDSDKTLKRFSALSKTLYNSAVGLLQENYDLVEALANRLLEVETMSGDSIKELLEITKEDRV